MPDDLSSQFFNVNTALGALGAFAGSGGNALSALAAIGSSGLLNSNKPKTPDTGSTIGALTSFTSGMQQGANLSRGISAGMSSNSLKQINDSLHTVVSRLETTNSLLQKIIDIQTGVGDINYQKTIRRNNRLALLMSKTAMGRLTLAAMSRAAGVNMIEYENMTRGAVEKGVTTHQEIMTKKLIDMIPMFGNIMSGFNFLSNKILQTKSDFTNESNLSLTQIIPNRLKAIGLIANQTLNESKDINTNINGIGETLLNVDYNIDAINKNNVNFNKITIQFYKQTENVYQKEDAHRDKQIDYFNNVLFFLNNHAKRFVIESRAMYNQQLEYHKEFKIFSNMIRKIAESDRLYKNKHIEEINSAINFYSETRKKNIYYKEFIQETYKFYNNIYNALDINQDYKDKLINPHIKSTQNFYHQTGEFQKDVRNYLDQMSVYLELLSNKIVEKDDVDAKFNEINNNGNREKNSFKIDKTKRFKNRISSGITDKDLNKLKQYVFNEVEFSAAVKHIGDYNPSALSKAQLDEGKIDRYKYNEWIKDKSNNIKSRYIKQELPYSKKGEWKTNNKRIEYDNSTISTINDNYKSNDTEAIKAIKENINKNFLEVSKNIAENNNSKAIASKGDKETRKYYSKISKLQEEQNQSLGLLNKSSSDILKNTITLRATLINISTKLPQLGSKIASSAIKLMMGFGTFRMLYKLLTSLTGGNTSTTGIGGILNNTLGANSITTGLSNLGGYIKDFFQNTIEKIKNSETYKNLKSFIYETLQAIWPTIKEYLIKGFQIGFKYYSLYKFPMLMLSSKSILIPIGSFIIRKTGSLIVSVSDWMFSKLGIDNFSEKIVKVFQSPILKKIFSFTGKIIGGLLNNIGLIFTGVSFFKTIYQWWESTLNESMGESFKKMSTREKIAKFIVDGFTFIISKGWEGIKFFFKDIIPALWDAAKRIVSNIWDWILGRSNNEENSISAALDAQRRKDEQEKRQNDKDEEEKGKKEKTWKDYIKETWDAILGTLKNIGKRIASIINIMDPTNIGTGFGALKNFSRMLLSAFGYEKEVKEKQEEERTSFSSFIKDFNTFLNENKLGITSQIERDENNFILTNPNEILKDGKLLGDAILEAQYEFAKKNPNYFKNFGLDEKSSFNDFKQALAEFQTTTGISLFKEKEKEDGSKAVVAAINTNVNVSPTKENIFQYMAEGIWAIEKNTSKETLNKKYQDINNMQSDFSFLRDTSINSDNNEEASTIITKFTNQQDRVKSINKDMDNYFKSGREYIDIKKQVETQETQLRNMKVSENDEEEPTTVDSVMTKLRDNKNRYKNMQNILDDFENQRYFLIQDENDPIYKDFIENHYIQDEKNNKDNKDNIATTLNKHLETLRANDNTLDNDLNIKYRDFQNGRVETLTTTLSHKNKPGWFSRGYVAELEEIINRDKLAAFYEYITGEETIIKNIINRREKIIKTAKDVMGYKDELLDKLNELETDVQKYNFSDSSYGGAIGDVTTMTSEEYTGRVNEKRRYSLAQENSNFITKLKTDQNNVNFVDYIESLNNADLYNIPLLREINYSNNNDNNYNSGLLKNALTNITNNDKSNINFKELIKKDNKGNEIYPTYSKLTEDLLSSLNNINFTSYSNGNYSGKLISNLFDMLLQDNEIKNKSDPLDKAEFEKVINRFFNGINLFRLIQQSFNMGLFNSFPEKNIEYEINKILNDEDFNKNSKNIELLKNLHSQKMTQPESIIRDSLYHYFSKIMNENKNDKNILEQPTDNDDVIKLITNMSKKYQTGGIYYGKSLTFLTDYIKKGIVPVANTHSNMEEYEKPIKREKTYKYISDLISTLSGRSVDFNANGELEISKINPDKQLFIDLINDENKFDINKLIKNNVKSENEQGDSPLDVLLDPSTWQEYYKDGWKDFKGQQSWSKYIYEAAKETGIDPELLSAMIMNESSGRLNVYSKTRAGYGLFQLHQEAQDDTHRLYSNTKIYDRMDPTGKGNIFLAAYYLKAMIDGVYGKRYGYNNVKQFLTAYNAGPSKGNINTPYFDRTMRYYGKHNFTDPNMPTNNNILTELSLSTNTSSTKDYTVPFSNVDTNYYSHDHLSIIVDKHKQKLYLYKGTNLIKTYTTSTGLNPGNKEKEGDMKTPVGTFPIIQIEDGLKKDKNGRYGPHFFRLDYKNPGSNKNAGIAIHGTNQPEMLGKPASHGCIRISNDNVKELKKYVYKNIPVHIFESVTDKTIGDILTNKINMSRKDIEENAKKYLTLNANVDFKGVNPELQKRVINYAIDFSNKYPGKKVILTSGFRSIEKQRELYNAYKTGKSKYPAAQPGHSRHNYGFAVDMSVKSGSIDTELLKKNGLIQPYPVKDPVHIEGIEWAGKPLSFFKNYTPAGFDINNANNNSSTTNTSGFDPSKLSNFEKMFYDAGAYENIASNNSLERMMGMIKTINYYYDQQGDNLLDTKISGKPNFYNTTKNFNPYNSIYEVGDNPLDIVSSFIPTNIKNLNNNSNNIITSKKKKEVNGVFKNNQLDILTMSLPDISSLKALALESAGTKVLEKQKLLDDKHNEELIEAINKQTNSFNNLKNINNQEMMIMFKGFMEMMKNMQQVNLNNSNYTTLNNSSSVVNSSSASNNNPNSNSAGSFINNMSLQALYC